MKGRVISILATLANPLICILCIHFFLPSAATAGRTMEIIDIDLQVSPNPIACGSSAEATVTIQTYPIGQMTRGVHTKLTLWDYDTLFRDGDDALDHESVVLSEDEGKVTATMTLHCQIKDAGCDLYGPAGNSGESGTDVFVTILGSDVESPHVYVKCQQIEIDAELALDGTETVVAGEDATVTMSSVQPITNLKQATWKLEYNSSDMTVENVSYLNQALAGSLSHTVNSDHILFTLASLPLPTSVAGPIVRVEFSSSTSPATVWDTTYVRVSDDATFFNHTGSQLDVCNGGAHSIFIAPDDTTPPQINPSMIAFNPMRISGTIGSVADDMDGLENYLTVTLFDENNELVSQEFANVDGSFTLDKFFELDMDKPSTLMLYNGLELSASYQFMPTVTPSGAIALLLLGNKAPTSTIEDIMQIPPPDGRDVILHALAIDPEGEDVSLQVDWGDGTVTDYSPLLPSGSTFEEIYQYDPIPPATYFVKVRAKDSQGGQGQWSDAFEVMVIP